MSYRLRKWVEVTQLVCPVCRRGDWIPTLIEPILMLVSPHTPIGHPELEHGMDGQAVLPITCKHCAHVSLYDAKQLRDREPEQ